MQNQYDRRAYAVKLFRDSNKAWRFDEVMR